VKQHSFTIFGETVSLETRKNIESQGLYLRMIDPWEYPGHLDAKGNIITSGSCGIVVITNKKPWESLD
jgi:hypothetical protein